MRDASPPAHRIIRNILSEFGDLAEWGPACDCGITLPVIKKLLGRTRHLITHPDGRTTYAKLFLSEYFEDQWNVEEYRFVLHQGATLVAQLKVSGPSSELAESITELVQNKLGYPYPVHVQFVEKIDWGSSRKREGFSVSNLPPAER